MSLGLKVQEPAIAKISRLSKSTAIGAKERCSLGFHIFQEQAVSTVFKALVVIGAALDGVFDLTQETAGELEVSQWQQCL